MPRISKRIILRALRAADIDVRGKGPNVSDDIQMVYVIDQLGHELSAEYGIGYGAAQPPGDFHRIIQLQITNPGGIIVTECGELVFGTVTRSLAWTDVTSETITATVTSGTIPALGIGFPRPPLTLVQTGFMPGADVRNAQTGSPARGEAFVWFANNVMRNYFVPGPEGTSTGERFFMFVGSQPVDGANMGIRWRELLP